MSRRRWDLAAPPETPAAADLPTRYGRFRAHAFPPDVASEEHLALVMGEVRGSQGVPVRLHSECLTGDVMGSLRCDCRAQLERSLALIEEEGLGVLLYLRQEGRGIGLFNKIRAYRLQDQGLDTVEANVRLGFEGDQRGYEKAARLLALLGPRSVRLITNNPDKVEGLRREGIDVVGRISLVVTPDDHNRRYLKTKAEKFGHLLDPIEEG